MKTLPEKLSDGLELALSDLIKCEEDKTYHVRMDVWHDKAWFDPATLEVTMQCEVCMAGAVMAKTLEAHPNKSLVPGDFELAIHHKLLALDAIREGDIKHAVKLWYNFAPLRREISHHDEREIIGRMVYEDQGIPNYKQNREAFFEGMREVVKELRHRGL